MSVVGAAVVLGAVVVMLLKLRVLRPSAALVCVLFGLVLGATSAGAVVNRTLDALGSGLWDQVTRL